MKLTTAISVKLGHSEQRLTEMAKVLGDRDAEKGEHFVDALVRLLTACGVYDLKMSEFGITREEFPEIIRLTKEHAKSEFAAEKKMLTDEECLQILENSYQ